MGTPSQVLLSTDKPSQEVTASEAECAYQFSQEVTDPYQSLQEEETNSSERQGSPELTQPTPASLTDLASQEIWDMPMEYHTKISTTADASLQELTRSDADPIDKAEQSVTTDDHSVTILSHAIMVALANKLANPISGSLPDPGSTTQQPVIALHSQELTSDNALNESSNTIIMDPAELQSQPPQDNLKTLHIKKQLSNLDNLDLAESTIDSDVDYLHFTDILDKNCSVNLDNLSQEDITFKKGLLKTSSPIHSSSPHKDTDTDETINEKCDPTYGKSRPVKKSMHPRRAPSASRIAAQKHINRTKGFTKMLKPSQQQQKMMPQPSQAQRTRTATSSTSNTDE